MAKSNVLLNPYEVIQCPGAVLINGIRATLLSYEEYERTTGKTSDGKSFILQFDPYASVYAYDITGICNITRLPNTVYLIAYNEFI